MTVVVYATPDDFQAWVDGDPPANASSLLRSASLLIAEQTTAAYYSANTTTGLPTDSAIVAAFRDATCAQAALWVNLGVDPNLVGLDTQAPKRSKGIGSARVDYDTSTLSSSVAFAARQEAISTLCPDAVRILRAAGLLSSHVWTYG